jgi:uncharacterized short protein YbdD (DUF466 family)
MKQGLLLAVLILTATGIIISILNMIPVPEYRVYDCSMAEFHPDIPKDVKEECRKLRVDKKYITV